MKRPTQAQIMKALREETKRLVDEYIEPLDLDSKYIPSYVGKHPVNMTIEERRECEQSLPPDFARAFRIKYFTKYDYVYIPGEIEC